MRIPSSPPRATTTSQPASKPVTADANSPTRASAWKGGSTTNVAREVRAALTSPQGRESFGKLLEKRLSDPGAGVNYGWNKDFKKPMEWALWNKEVGADAITATVRGKELVLQADGSGFEGRATLTGSSPKALDAAIQAALKDLNAVTERNRGG